MHEGTSYFWNNTDLEAEDAEAESHTVSSGMLATLTRHSKDEGACLIVSTTDH
jgi:hypothetical protein